MLLLLFSGRLSAQFNWAEVGVNGLTCSQCCRNVEMSLRKLDFVEDVQMNLENTVGKITFRKEAVVSMEKIAQAVVDAGFSVRYLKAEFDFSKTTVEGNCFTFQETHYQLTGTKGPAPSGAMVLVFSGKKFMPPKDWKKEQKQLKPSCGAKDETVLFVHPA